MFFAGGCRPGYKLNGKTQCVDVDECQIDTICVNTPGGFQCDCIEGYRGNGRTGCLPINKCDEKPCGRYKECIPTGPGKHVCKCRPGYIAIGDVCNDINECTKSGACHKLADCENPPCSYTCT